MRLNLRFMPSYFFSSIRLIFIHCFLCSVVASLATGSLYSLLDALHTILQVDLTEYVEKHGFVFDAVLDEDVSNDEVINKLHSLYKCTTNTDIYSKQPGFILFTGVS